MPITTQDNLRNFQNRITFGKGTPQKAEGKKGDITIREMKDGLKLFVFYKNNWQGIKIGRAFDKLERDIEKAKKLPFPIDEKKSGKRKFGPLWRAIEYLTGTKSSSFAIDSIGTGVLLKNDSGILKVRNLENSADASIVAKELRFPTTLAIGSLTAETGQTSFNTDDGGFRFWGNGIVIDAYSDADSSNEICNIVGLSKAADCSLKLFDGATLKWYMAYDYSTDSVLGAGALVFGTGGTIGTGERVKIKLTTGDADTVMLWQYDDTNYATLTTAANGATTIKTVDSDGIVGHLSLMPDGDLKLDPESGNNIISATDKLYLDGGTETYIDEESSDRFRVTVGGDEMLILDEATDTVSIGATNWIAGIVSGATIAESSAANSAYAGMILGYTRLQGDGTNSVSYEIQDTMTVEDSTHQITFKTPPSEKVEIETTCLINVNSTDTEINIGVSDNSTYNKIGELFEYDTSGVIFSDDEVDDHIVVCKFVLEAAQLVAIGVSNTFYIGFSTGGSTKTAYLQYGLRSSHGLCDHPFVIKATALPATIYDGT